jgi:hypothetical protein
VKLRDVVLSYFKDPRAVDFVATFAIESKYSSPLLATKRESHAVKAQVFSSRDDHVMNEVRLAFEHLAMRLPCAETSAANARTWYASGAGQAGFRKQPMEHSANQISVSARWLMELLAGRISVDEAFREYGIDGQGAKGPRANPFRRMLDGGKLPEQIRVVRDENTDDDAVEFDFGRTDAAVAPFQRVQ